ncbi:MAG: succinylglutamate desuccinylase/aspartoacylase family protein [Rhodobacteraceae bacterium]|nr:succinylglutamate desuccinylase/aspartoacylase family protein [Paracoccaceae bacterium]
MLNVLTQVPPALLDARPQDLADVLGGPTLFHLTGAREPALFVSVLLHGDETTGFEAIQRILRATRRDDGAFALPRSLSLFIGNVAAAKHSVRRLPSQPDYNRVWSGDVFGDCPEKRMMQDITATMKTRGVFASIDIHNNTGRNPHYGCINHPRPEFLALAGMFSPTAVFFRRPAEVQSMAFADFCVAVTVECGQARERNAVDHAERYLMACLALDALPQPAPDALNSISLFHTVAVVKVPRTAEIAVAPARADLAFNPQLEDTNFQVVPSGSVFASTGTGKRVDLEVTDDAGRDVGARYFGWVGDELRLKQDVIPSMLTTDEQAIRQDCLCYIMERYPLAR